MEQYLEILDKVVKKGVRKENRTGIDTFAIAGAIFEHDMSEGFPLLTTKKMGIKTIATELEFFIKGLTDKKWLQDRNCTIWNEWCNPKKVPYGHDEETKKKMAEERDLGPIYGFQWRHFDAAYDGYDKDYSGKGIDQLENIVSTLKTNPTDRRMIVTAWNPKQSQEMALPPCHYGFQVAVIGNKLNLMWNQRSVDTMLGLPYNIASYGLLLHLLAEETGFKEGKLIGFLGDVHVYENHMEGAELQLKREPYPLPKIKTRDFSSIFNWDSSQSKVVDYMYHPKIDLDIAV